MFSKKEIIKSIMIIIRWLTSTALMGMGIRCGSCQ